MDNNANYFVVFVLGVCLLDCALSAPEVRLSVGIVRGSDKQAVTTLKPYHAYYGVPFAEPPTGPLRFKPTVRIAPSDPNRIISSDGFRARCAQSQTVFSQTSQSQQKPQSEDCLYLNIFTPDAPNGRFDLGNGRQKKVLLWIHGGGFVAGSADTFSPARMVTDYDVIVVTIQYRVGILGFLSSEDDNLPGNLALRDSLEAIRWTKDFIGEFGGDGSDITVFGQSAGSALVSILSISPLSKGLFTKAIMISGTASAHWAVNENPEESFYQLAQDTGCRPWFYFPGIKNLYNRRIVDCLEKLPVDSLLNEGDSVFEDNGFSGNSQGGGGGGGGGGFSGNAQGGGGGFSGNSQGGGGLSGNSQGGGFSGNSQGGGFPGQGERPVDTSLFDGSSLKPIPYRPVVDGDLLPRDPKTLLSDVDYLKQNGVLDRKYIVGANNNEATIRYLFIYSIFGSDFPPEFVDRDVIERSDKAETYKVFGLPVTSDVVSYVDLMYNYPQDSQGMAPIQGRFDIVTDTNYVVPTIQFANSLLSASPETEVYLFLFDYYPELKDKNSPLKGSAHGTNTYYIFDEAPEKSESLLSYANVYTPSAIPIMRYYRSLFTNLANFGSPAGSGNTPWPRYTLEEQKYLAIDEVAEVRERMYGHRVSLWTEFLPRQYKSILSNRNK